MNADSATYLCWECRPSADRMSRSRFAFDVAPHSATRSGRLAAGPFRAVVVFVQLQVALVSAEPHDDLVRYLERVGFVVRAFRTALGAPREGTLVWLADHATDDRTVIDAVRRWLGAKPRVRVIVVTDRPARLRAASGDVRGRVLVLPAPVFGWQLVEALRESAIPEP